MPFIIFILHFVSSISVISISGFSIILVTFTVFLAFLPLSPIAIKVYFPFLDTVKILCVSLTCVFNVIFSGSCNITVPSVILAITSISTFSDVSSFVSASASISGFIPFIFSSTCT